jgi:hypothetical protein
MKEILFPVLEVGGQSISNRAADFGVLNLIHDFKDAQ